jgi:hypothetical protein
MPITQVKAYPAFQEYYREEVLGKLGKDAPQNSAAVGQTLRETAINPAEVF